MNIVNSTQTKHCKTLHNPPVSFHTLLTLYTLLTLNRDKQFNRDKQRPVEAVEVVIARLRLHVYTSIPLLLSVLRSLPQQQLAGLPSTTTPQLRVEQHLKSQHRGKLCGCPQILLSSQCIMVKYLMPFSNGGAS